MIFRSLRPPLGRQTNPTLADLTPFIFEYHTENPEDIARVLDNSDRLVIRPASMALVGGRADVDLGLAAEDVRARTAEIILDYGDVHPTERYRVAVDTGIDTDLSLADVFSQRLNLDFEFGTGVLDGRAMQDGLIRVGDVEMTEASSSYWLVAHERGGATSTVYTPLAAAWSADDVIVRRGDVVHLMYVTDRDLDGLSDRTEQAEQTDPLDADTDGDGIDDGVEVYGWFSNLSAPPV